MGHGAWGKERWHVERGRRHLPPTTCTCTCTCICICISICISICICICICISGQTHIDVIQGRAVLPMWSMWGVSSGRVLCVCRLLRQICLPAALPAATLQMANVWVGGELMKNGLHYDNYDNLLHQVNAPTPPPHHPTRCLLALTLPPLALPPALLAPGPTTPRWPQGIPRHPKVASDSISRPEAPLSPPPTSIAASSIRSGGGSVRYSSHRRTRRICTTVPHPSTGARSWCIPSVHDVTPCTTPCATTCTTSCTTSCTTLCRLRGVATSHRHEFSLPAGVSNQTTFEKVRLITSPLPLLTPPLVSSSYLIVSHLISNRFATTWPWSTSLLTTSASPTHWCAAPRQRSASWTREMLSFCPAGGAAWIAYQYIRACDTARTATHRSRGLSACSGLSFGPERSTIVSWMPTRGCCTL